MPWKIPGPCRHKGCPGKQEGKTGYCVKHQPVYELRERLRLKDLAKRQIAGSIDKQTDRRFYKSKRWRQLRQLQLNEEPLCRVCGAPGRVVDHIRQISRGGERYDQSNLQTLCSPCHDEKRRRESTAAINDVKSGKKKR